MRSIKKLLAVMMLLAVVFAAIPSQAFADGEVKVSLKRSGPATIYAGSSEYYTITAQADSTTPYKVVLEPADDGLVVLTSPTGSISSTEEQNFTFSVKALDGAKEELHGLTIKAVDPEAPTKVYSKSYFEVSVAHNRGGFSQMSGLSFDVSYDVDGEDHFTAGKTQTLRLYFYNRGGKSLRNASLKVELPKDVTIASGSTTYNIGYMDMGTSKMAEYKINVGKDILSGSYPITATISGSMAQSVGGEVTMSETAYTETVYIPINGKDKEEEKEPAEFDIVDVSVPASINQDGTFTLTFSVKNNGKEEQKNVNVLADIPSATPNTSKNNFVIKSLAAGAKQTFSVDMKAVNPGFAQFKITVSDSDGKNAVSQFAGINVIEKKETEDVEFTPILMVSSYSYGEEAVESGKEFDLSVTLLNTSTSESLKNIKVTLDSGGRFLPVGTSTSYYISSIAPGAANTKTIHMSCKGDVDPGSISVTVSSAYENHEGKAFSSSDTISVPVTQKVRFVVDEILDPGYLVAGENAYLSVNYYNMGKDLLYNLRISAEGDFYTDSPASSYVGNVSSGKSDYYSLNFIPNQPGPLEGKVVFTFEDAYGNEQIVEKEFTFNIGEPYVYDDPGFTDFPEEEPGFKMPVWGWILIAVAALALIKVVLTVLKKRKIKKQEALDLDE